MDVFFLLIALSVGVVIVIGIFLMWAVFAGQFDDTEKNAKSILEDDDTGNS